MRKFCTRKEQKLQRISSSWSVFQNQTDIASVHRCLCIHDELQRQNHFAVAAFHLEINFHCNFSTSFSECDVVSNNFDADVDDEGYRLGFVEFADLLDGLFDYCLKVTSDKQK